MGPKGEKGEFIERKPDSTGSVTYIRWGKSSCPNVPGTSLIYSGKCPDFHLLAFKCQHLYVKIEKRDKEMGWAHMQLQDL